MKDRPPDLVALHVLSREPPTCLCSNCLHSGTPRLFSVAKIYLASIAMASSSGAWLAPVDPRAAHNDPNKPPIQHLLLELSQLQAWRPKRTWPLNSVTGVYLGLLIMSHTQVLLLPLSSFHKRFLSKRTLTASLPAPTDFPVVFRVDQRPVRSSPCALVPSSSPKPHPEPTWDV